MEAAGEVLTAAQRESLEAHRAACPGCDTLEAAAALLRDDDGEGSAPPLDDLTAQRLVNDVLDALDAPDARPGPATAGQLRYRLLAAAAALLLVGTGLGVVLHQLLRRSGPDTLGGAPTARPLAARVQLSAGRVQLDGAPAEVGLAVRPGQTLRIQGGRAALGLPDAAAVLLEGSSSVRVQQLSATATTLRLERGKLLASVRPRPGRPHFTVLTAAGRVEVTGTVFAVEHTAAGVTVSVLRGQVRVHERGRRARLVGRGMQTVLRAADGPDSSGPHAATRPMDADAQSEAWQRVRVLDLIHAKQTAKVTLQSRPAGALVFVDGLLLGQTPLVSRLRAGHHRIVLRKVGHRPVSKDLHVAEGADSTWDVTLASAFAAQRAVTAPGPTPGLSPSPAPLVSRTPARHRTPPTPAPRATRSPGSTPTAAPPVTPPAAPTARELATRARKQRADHKWRAAAATFAELIRRYPASGRARTARVSLGLILLDRLGNAGGALAQFSAYLAVNQVGALAPEASYGRIRALRRLGRRAAEIRALQRFLRLYPRSIQVKNVRRRLGRLGVKVSAPPMRQMGLGTMSGPK